MTLQNMTSAFKPSFPNPKIWTEELIKIRKAEFAAFNKTPEGIAEQQAFDIGFNNYLDRMYKCV